MAKRIDKLFAIEAYDTVETCDDKGGYTWARVKRAKRQLLDGDGCVTDSADAVELFASEKDAKAAINRQFGDKKDDEFKVAEPTVVTFVRG